MRPMGAGRGVRNRDRRKMLKEKRFQLLILSPPKRIGGII